MADKDGSGEDQINMTIYTTDPIRNRIKAAAALRGKSMSVFVVETVLKELGNQGEDKEEA
jgi:uncharacterized protein (DUF1778 family)